MVVPLTMPHPGSILARLGLYTAAAVRRSER